MEKVLNNNKAESDEHACLILKAKLEQIMATFLAEREQYEEQHNARIIKLETMISQKNDMIVMLRRDLKNTSKQLEDSQKEAENYKAIVKELKKEFFKMASVVNKLNSSSKPDCQKDNQLKKTKSQWDIKLPSTVSNYNLCVSPIKTIRVDINNYFKKIKQSAGVLHEQYVCDKKSIHSKNTQDRSFMDTLSNKYAETTEFKELLNCELGLQTKLKDARSSLKNIDPKVGLFTGSQLCGFKQNGWSVKL